VLAEHSMDGSSRAAVALRQLTAGFTIRRASNGRITACLHDRIRTSRWVRARQVPRSPESHADRRSRPVMFTPAFLLTPAAPEHVGLHRIVIQVEQYDTVIPNHIDQGVGLGLGHRLSLGKDSRLHSRTPPRISFASPACTDGVNSI
jgi:hypothetical protein